MKLIMFAIAVGLQAQTILKPDQIGLPSVDPVPAIVALVDGKLINVEIGGGIEIVKTSTGKYILRVTSQPAPFVQMDPQQFTLTKLPNGNYPACKGIVVRNTGIQNASHFTFSPAGEIIAPWPATDTITCITFSAPAAMSFPR